MLTALDQPDLVLCWVVLVVGVHFLPSARSFRAPVFTPFGLALVLLTLVGGVGVLAGLRGVRRAVAWARGDRLLGSWPWPSPPS